MCRGDRKLVASSDPQPIRLKQLVGVLDRSNFSAVDSHFDCTMQVVCAGGGSANLVLEIILDTTLL